ncbi:MAG: hypothetical protein DSZ23_00310 [Thermodesulfatator sp.]|nr:MAG: hypothetical protein DSZ23_00310 [Thermodesulfatator sp.]
MKGLGPVQGCIIILEPISRLIANGILLAWPVIPLFWLPVRLFPWLLPRLGRGLYGLTGILWLAVASLILRNQDILLSGRLGLPAVISMAGWLVFVSGLILQAWTALVLGRRIIGLPELDSSSKKDAILETRSPFNLCRHPTYLAHFFIFSGAAVATGFYSLLCLSVVDFLLTRLIIIPLEEKELQDRFGTVYTEYKKRVPCLFPRIKR